MKKIFLILFVVFSAQCLTTKASPFFGFKERHSVYFSLDDGWYKSIVKYTNYATGTNSTYRLEVKVLYDRVTVISFGNGGSVHSGMNNEGYLYTGGNLQSETDYYGRIIAYTTTVNVSDSNGMRTYKIRIE